jgi:hypothetical protein
MLRRPILLAALACVAAAPARTPAAKAPPAKPPPAKAAAAKPAAARPALPAAAFDSQDPQSLIELLTRAGAKAQTGRRDEDSVLLAVTSTAATFSVQYAGCDRQGRKCQGALFDAQEPGAPTLGQVNAFNQTSVNCRIVLDRAPRAHVLYSTLLLKSDTREALETHLAAWQGCIVEARDFLRDPAGYLANAA